MIHRMKPPLDLDTPKGPAIAEFLIDRGPHSNLEWICFIKDTGECWTYENPHIRISKNITMGIRVKSECI